MRYGTPTEHHPSLSSTMDRATLRAKEGAAEGLVVIADTQTAGRGQRQRHWHSPAGSGLYFSLLLRPSLPPEEVSQLTLAAGVAVASALSPLCAAQLGIKWPNDILVAAPGPHYGKKLAGLLMEASTEAQAVQYAVLGIGLNLTDAAFPPELAPAAVCMEQLGGETSAEALLPALLAALEQEIGALCREGFSPLAAAWTARAFGLNQQVQLTQGGRVLTGPLLGLAPDGALKIGGQEPQVFGDLKIPGVPEAPRLKPTTSA